MGRRASDYAVYKGEELLHIGTIKECAEKMNISPNTVRYYATPSYQRRVSSQKNHLIVVKLDDE